MLWTDYMGKVRTSLTKTLYCTLLIFIICNQTNAQALVCDDQVNVSLSDNCEATITVDMILEGPYPAVSYSIDIEGVTGNVVTNTGLYSVTVSQDVAPFNSCWGHILVEDKIAPVVTCPCATNDGTDPDCVLPVLCSDGSAITVPDHLKPTITDNCNDADDYTLTYRDDFDGQDCSSSTLTRTWIFSLNGSSVSCQSIYTISTVALTIDEMDDVNSTDGGITPPMNLNTLTCGIGTSPEELVAYFDQEYMTLFPCAESVCDTDHPDHNPALLAIYLKDKNFYVNRRVYPMIDGVPLNNVVCNTVTSYSDTRLAICNTSSGCGDNVKIIREWTTYDWCDPLAPPIKFTQVIKAADITPPTIHVDGFTRSVDPWGCSTAIYFPEPITLADNCSSNVFYTVTGSGSTSMYNVQYDPTVGYWIDDLPVGQHTFYYNAYDCCDNVTSEGVVVTVVDATPPVAVTKQDIVVSLIPNPGQPNQHSGLTKIFAENVDNGSFDGCGPVKLEIRRETEYCDFPSSLTYNNDFHPMDDTLDLDDGKFVTFCCNDLADHGVDEDGDGVNDYALIKVWMRVWDDGDRDGHFGSAGDNFSEVWSHVRLEDKSRPTVVCPGDVVIQCDNDSGDLTLTGEGFAVSSCGPATAVYEDIDSHLTTCNEGYIIRRWSVATHPEIYCNQRITLSGNLTGDPIEVFFPSDTIISCTDDLDNIYPYWTSGSCDQLAYSVDRDTFYFAEGACFKVLNYWTVIDWCTYDPNDPTTDGIWDAVQVVKIVDNDKPTFTGCNDVMLSVNSACVDTAVMLTNSAVDLGVCSSNRLIWTVQVDINNDWVVDYTFSSRAPVNSAFYIPTTASGEEVKVTLPEEVQGSMVNHRVAWRVTDGCGNDASCTTYFMVADKKPPTPYCVSISTALMENGQVELWACDFNNGLGATDNCTAAEDLRYTFSNVSPDDDPAFNDNTGCSGRIFTCDDITNPDGTVLSLDIYVWDEKDNYDYCTVFLTLIDNQDSCEDIGAQPRARIGGEIGTENGEMVEEVMVELVSPQPRYPAMEMTDNDGHFMFYQNPMDKNYQITSTKDGDDLNGVSTLDLVIIQKHILGIEALSSPFKRIASDVNNDNLVTAIDLIEIRKLILGIYDEFPDVNSWRMVDESKIIDPDNPFPVSEARIIQSLDNNMMKEDFVAVKMGDVNGNAQVGLFTDVSVDKRSSKSLELTFDNVTYEAGDLVTMTLSNDEINELVGLQFTLETEGLELVDIIGEGMEVSESNFASLSSDITTFSWNSDNTITDTEIFTVTFRATASGELSESVTINSNVTKAEAYVGKHYETIPVILSGRNNLEQTYNLLQNTPNPYSKNTTISFVLPQTATATLSIMDVNGRLLWSSERTYNKGLNNVMISQKEINQSGVLYYKLESGEYSATKKMIKID